MKNKHVLITRGGKRGRKFANQIIDAGGIPHIVPLIDFKPYKDPNKEVFLARMTSYDWIIFTSRNGVDYFFQQIKPEEFQVDSIRFAVVGEKTREALAAYGFSSAFMPTIYTAEDFADQYFTGGVRGRVLVVKGNLASQTIADACTNASMLVDEWIVYETFEPEGSAERLQQMIQVVEFDFITFTSPSTFHHFQRTIEAHQLQEQVQSATFVSIGKVTKRTIEASGYPVAICPNTYTIDAMFDAICQYIGEE